MSPIQWKNSLRTGCHWKIGSPCTSANKQHSLNLSQKPFRSLLFIANVLNKLNRFYSPYSFTITNHCRLGFPISQHTTASTARIGSTSKDKGFGLSIEVYINITRFQVANFVQLLRHVRAFSHRPRTASKTWRKKLTIWDMKTYWSRYGIETFILQK
jgi:hypothetical protein